MEGISMRFHRFFVCCWLALTLLPRQEGYITMSNIAFVPFSCFSHPYGGSSLLTTTNILCGSGDHGFMQVYGVILGTLPWSVVFFFSETQMVESQNVCSAFSSQQANFEKHLEKWISPFLRFSFGFSPVFSAKKKTNTLAVSRSFMHGLFDRLQLLCMEGTILVIQTSSLGRRFDGK